MDGLKIKRRSVTLVDHVEDKLLNYFRENKMKPGDSVPNEGKLAEAHWCCKKGFCSTKGIYYYGLKLHALAFNHPHHLPFPEQFQLTPASENDLNLFLTLYSYKS